MSKTVTRLFDNYTDARNAVEELERIGVPHNDLSIIANNTDGTLAGNGTPDGARHDGDHDGVNDHGDVTRGATTGALLGGAGGLLAGIGLLAIPGLGPIVAAGWLASTAAGVGIGAAGGAATGSIVGALKNAGHSEEEAHVYSEGVRRGGTLVSARVSDSLRTETEAVLLRHKSVDAETRGQAYRQDGWTTFDERAVPYTSEQVGRERTLYTGGTYQETSTR